jgi:hypothetical protein
MKRHPALTKRGWYNTRRGSNPRYEGYRHRLARFGIKTRGLSPDEIKQKHDMLMAQRKKKKKYERVT